MAAGLCDSLLGPLLEWWLGTEVSKCLLSGPAQARGGLSQEPAGGVAASCLPATAYPAVVPALLSGIYFGCGFK